MLPRFCWESQSRSLFVSKNYFTLTYYSSRLIVEVGIVVELDALFAAEVYEAVTHVVPTRIVIALTFLTSFY